MAKENHREKLLNAGILLMMETGFFGCSVRDVTQQAGVPHGSFTYHFRSKDEFGLEVLEQYFRIVRHNMLKTLENPALEPLPRLEAWIDLQIAFLKQYQMRKGCLIGNLSAEASAHTEAIRERLSEIYAEVQKTITQCLEAAVQHGDVPAGNMQELAGFLYASLMGAIHECKVNQSAEALERYKCIVFSCVLR